MKTFKYLALLIFVLCFISSCKRNQACGVPTGLSSHVVNTTAIAWWHPVGGATSYQVQYRIVGSPSWTVQYGLISDSTIFSSLNSDSSYEWQVESFCANGPSGYSASSIFQAGNIIGSCSYNNLIAFNATSSVASPASNSLTAYDDSSYMSFVFSPYPTSSGSYLVVSPGSSAAGNTVSMTARLYNVATFSSTGTDHVSANITISGGKISLRLPSVKATNIVNPADSGTFSNVIINQQ